MAGVVGGRGASSCWQSDSRREYPGFVVTHLLGSQPKVSVRRSEIPEIRFRKHVFIAVRTRGPRMGSFSHEVLTSRTPHRGR